MLFYNENKNEVPLQASAVGTGSAVDNFLYEYGIELPKEHMNDYYNKFISNIHFGVTGGQSIVINSCKVKIFRTNNINEILTTDPDLEEDVDINNISLTPFALDVPVIFNDVSLSQPIEITNDLNTIILVSINLDSSANDGFIMSFNTKVDSEWNNPNVSNIFTSIFNNNSTLIYFDNCEWNIGFSLTEEAKNPVPLVTNRKKLEINNKNKIQKVRTSVMKKNIN